MTLFCCVCKRVATLFQIERKMVKPDGFLSNDEIESSPIRERCPCREEESDQDSSPEFKDSEESQVDEDQEDDGRVENDPPPLFLDSLGLLT